MSGHAAGAFGRHTAHPIAHVGYVVECLAEAVQRWSVMLGAGPFYALENVAFDEVSHAGDDVVFEHSTAFGQWGAVPVELWEIHRLKPAGVLGPRFAPLNQLNHFSYVVDDVAAESARLEEVGFPAILSARMGSVHERIHDAPQLGHVIEVQQDGEVPRRFFDGLVRASRDWDGRRPLRCARELVPEL